MIELVPYGDAAWRIDLPGEVNRAALTAALRAWPGVVDVVVTERHACVCFDPARPPVGVAGVIDACRGVAAPAGRTHVVRVRYGGPDVAAFGISVDELAALHSARPYRVQLVGFLPGFAYLGELDPALVRPRRASPRTRVPAGSVAIAGPYTGVYPFDSPGGWHLIGTAIDFVAFDPARGATLQLGDEVRFECST